MDEFLEMIGLLSKAPAISYGDSTATIGPDGEWSITFSIDIDHPVGWRVVQKFADLLNDPIESGGIAMFHPSPRDEFCPDGRMRWVIGGHTSRIAPKEFALMLYSGLPHPLHDVRVWQNPDP